MCIVIQSLSRVRLSVTLRTAVRRVSLSFTISWSLLKFMSIESVMPNVQAGSYFQSLTVSLYLVA